MLLYQSGYVGTTLYLSMAVECFCIWVCWHNFILVYGSGMLLYQTDFSGTILHLSVVVEFFSISLVIMAHLYPCLLWWNASVSVWLC